MAVDRRINGPKGLVFSFVPTSNEETLDLAADTVIQTDQQTDADALLSPIQIVSP